MPPDPPDPVVGWVDRTGAPVLVVGSLVGFAAAWFYLRRWQFFDPLDIEIMAIYHSGNWFAPYHGHLSIVPVGLYKALYATVGIGVTWPYTVLALAVFVCVPLALWMDYRTRVAPGLAALAVVAVTWCWPSQDTIRFNFMINFFIPVVMMLIARNLIARDRRRDDAASAVAVVVALCSSGVGLVVVVVLAAELIARRAARRALWYVVPVALWAVWYFTSADTGSSVSLGDIPGYAWSATVAIFSGFTFGWRPGGVLVVIGMAVLVTVAHRRWHTLGSRAVGPLAGLVAFIAVTAVARVGESNITTADSPRYIWLGNLFLILIALECFTGRTIGWRTLAAGAAVTSLGATAMLVALPSNRAWLDFSTDRIAHRLYLAEAMPMYATPGDVEPSDALFPGSWSTLGEYRDLVRHLGSPMTETGFGDRGFEPNMQKLDRQLLELWEISPVVSTSRPACPTGWIPTTVDPERGALRARPGETITFSVTGDEPILVGISRFARKPRLGTDWTLDPPATMTWAFPEDDAARRWNVHVGGTVTSAARCDPEPSVRDAS